MAESFQHHIDNDESIVDAVTDMLPSDHLPALIKEEPAYQHIVEVQSKKPKERKVHQKYKIVDLCLKFFFIIFCVAVTDLSYLQ